MLFCLLIAAFVYGAGELVGRMLDDDAVVPIDPFLLEGQKEVERLLNE